MSRCRLLGKCLILSLLLAVALTLVPTAPRGAGSSDYVYIEHGELIAKEGFVSGTKSVYVKYAVGWSLESKPVGYISLHYYSSVHSDELPRWMEGWPIIAGEVCCRVPPLEFLRRPLPRSGVVEDVLLLEFMLKEEKLDELVVVIVADLYGCELLDEAKYKMSMGGGCFIATAAYGSELADEVQFLRSFRDEKVATTLAGSSFMEVFNAVYYSFSPALARVVRSSGPLRAVVRLFLHSLIGALKVSTWVYEALSFNEEVAVVAAGLTATALIGAVYLAPLAALAPKRRWHRKWALALALTLSLVAAACYLRLPLLVEATTVLLAVVNTVLSALTVREVAECLGLAL